MTNKIGSYIKLGEVVELSPAKPKIDGDIDVTFFGMADVSEDGQIINNNTRKYKEVCCGFTSFQDNDVLVAKITPCFENGKGTLVQNAINGIGFGSTEFHVLRPSSKINPYYLLSITQSHSFRVLGESEMTGSVGQKRVHADFIRDYRVYLPPLAEQQKIAAILRTWDDAIQKMDKLIITKERRIDHLIVVLFQLSNVHGEKHTFGNFLRESNVAGSTGESARKITIKLYGKGIVAKKEKMLAACQHVIMSVAQGSLSIAS